MWALDLKATSCTCFCAVGEIGVPGINPHKHKKNMLILHRKTPGPNWELNPGLSCSATLAKVVGVVKKFHDCENSCLYMNSLWRFYGLDFIGPLCSP